MSERAGQPIPRQGRAAALFIGGAALFLAALDFSINVSLPTMRDSLHETLVSVQWVIIIYHAARSGTGFVAGGLADRFGLKWLLLSGAVAYTLAVGLIAMQSGLPGIVALRVLQGVGVAILFTLGPALVAKAFAPEGASGVRGPSFRRGAALGITLAAVGAGQLAGTLGGGWLVQNFDWRAVFWARVPVGVAIILAGALMLKEARPAKYARHASERAGRFDWPGAALLFSFLFLLVLALSFARLDGWTALRPAACFAASAALLGGFIWWSRRAPRPLIPAGLWAVEGVVPDALSNLIATTGTFVMWFLFPFYVSDVLGRSPLTLGAMLATMAAAGSLGSVAGGWLGERSGERAATFLAALVSAGGVALTGVLGRGGDMGAMAGGVALLGFGFGMHQAASYALALRSVPARMAGAASASLSVTQTIGTVASVSLMTMFFNHVRPGQGFAGAYSNTFLLAAGVTVTAGVVVLRPGGRTHGGIASGQRKAA